MINVNEELADIELAELWDRHFAEWERISEKYKNIPLGERARHRLWRNEGRELKRIFFEKRDAILKKYGLPIPE